MHCEALQQVRLYSTYAAKLICDRVIALSATVLEQSSSTGGKKRMKDQGQEVARVCTVSFGWGNGAVGKVIGLEGRFHVGERSTQ